MLEEEYKKFGIGEIFVRCEKTNSKIAIELFKKLDYVYFEIYTYKKKNLYYNIYKKRLLL